MRHPDVMTGCLSGIELRHYRKVVSLARKQLRAIDSRLAAEGGRLQGLRFQYRHRRIEKRLRQLLRLKHSTHGAGAGAALVEDLKAIEKDERNWPQAGKAVADYIRIILYGQPGVLPEEETPASGGCG